MTRRGASTWCGVTLLFVLLTAGMLWPLARHAGSLAPDHQDVYFNMWRLRWFAHALATSPAHLFDANIFYPEKNTFAYSDAMPVEGLIAAPFARANPVLVHNMMMLAPIAFSAVAVFALCRHLTGSRGAGIVAGVAFAFAPYRFEHIMHMELQWTVWMPLAFLALHRFFDSGRWRDGVAVGLCLALQLLSSIYYGVFLAMLLGVGAVLFYLSDCRLAPRRVLPPLVAGALVLLVAGVAYSLPYRRVHQLVGDRPMEQVNMFSAQPHDYVIVPDGNWLYGNRGRPGHGERRLFPGAVVVLLAFAALLLRPPAPRLLVYVVLLAAAFDVSLGFSGMTFPILSHVAPLRGLRAIARLGIFVVMFLSILAAYGYSFLVHASRPAVRIGLCALLVAAMLTEYATTVRLVAFPASPPEIYGVLARQPPGVVAELPIPAPGDVFEARAAYFSTFDWLPLVNGYSGNFPPSYFSRCDRLSEFPDDRALLQLRRDGVAYLLVHEGSYSSRLRAEDVNATLLRAGMVDMGTFDAGDGPARLYRVR